MTVTTKINFKRGRAGRKRVEAQRQQPAMPARVPHVARLMALAIHLDGLLRAGKVKDYAEIARLGHVSRARVTQIMNLLNLAPDVQEAVLFLSPTEHERERVQERLLRPIASETSWTQQRNQCAGWRGISS